MSVIYEQAKFVCFIYMHTQKVKFKFVQTRIDVYETLCPQQMLVHKGGKIKNWGGECRQRCHTYKIAVSKYQGRCEQRSEVFVKIENKNWGGGSGVVGGGGG